MQKNNKKPQPRKGAVPTPGKTRRRKSRLSAMRDSSLYTTKPSSFMTPGAVSLPLHGLKGKKFPLPKGLSEEGLNYLKCAFAPPDFAMTGVAGVPDAYEGSSLVKKHRGVFSATVPANTDRYILLLPTPGFAYWQLDKAAGQPVVNTDTFQSVAYNDYGSMFETQATGTGVSTDDVVDRFRFASNHIEIVPTVNAVGWTGSIQAWKIPVNLIDRPNAGSSTTVGDFKSVSGLQGVNATNSNQYTAPFNLGVYAGAYNSDSTFMFQQISSNLITVPFAITGGDFCKLNAAAGTPPIQASFTGLDNCFESIVIKISGVGANTNNSYILKTWACVEYQVIAGSSLYEYMSLSPCDPVAMKLYREIIKRLPIGVTYMDNDTFWERVLGIIRMISGGLSFLPGPYGQIAGGVHAATGLLS